MYKENITVAELWDYFLEHRDELENEYQMIASNEEQGVEIYMTEEHGFPFFSVDIDGIEVQRSETCSCLDAENTYDQLLVLYIFDENEAEGSNPNSYAEDEDEGYLDDKDRVEEIVCAIEDLLYVLLEEDPIEAGISTNDIDEIASIVEQYLYDNHGISVRHPTNVDGKMVQYPFCDPSDNS